uniref:Nucleoporin Nup43-like n=1 Tax=Saccoglossus kowalevskii TaxID=10224 RepID=A0ABM0LZ64_SACKO
NADSCTIHAVSYLKQYEVITVSSTGQLKIWDLRQSSSEPSRTFVLTGERVPLHCIDKHPNQPHIVATGGQDGVLTIWDMRQDTYPVTLLDAHSSDMWEVKFHPSNPDNLFTCSEDGSVWHWDNTSSQVSMATQLSTSMAGSGTENVWEVKFHPSNPDNLFTCSEDGSVWHWDNTSSQVSMATQLSTSMAGSGAGIGGGQGPSTSRGFGFAALSSNSHPIPGTSSPWLSNDASKHRNLEVTTLLPHNKMPVNTIDIESNNLLCGTDGEAVYVVRNLTLR